ncbi:MAG: YIP1 family protein [Elusimicrobia bacterium]|nr:YIP1 family protein [Elusimicrobiota bacterium]
MTGPASEDLAAGKGAGLKPAPSLPAMLGQSLAALLRGSAVFDEAASAATPPLWVLAANIAVFSVAGTAASLLLKAVAGADPQSLAPAHAVAAAAALMGSFAAALLVDVIARLADSDADYLRSYQIVSLSSGVAIVAVAACASPALWFLPTAWGSVLVGAGIVKLHSSKARRVVFMVGALAAAALAGQWYGVKQYQALVVPARSAATVLTEFEKLRAELQKSLPALPQEGAPATRATEAAVFPAPEGEAGLSSPAPLASSAGQNAFRNPESLVLPPQGLPLPAMPEHAADPAQTQEAIRSSMGMVRALLPMLNNPDFAKGLPPAQAKQLRALLKALEGLERSASQGKPPEQADMAAISQAFMAMGTTIGAPPIPQQKPGAGATRGGKSGDAPAPARKPAPKKAPPQEEGTR